MTKINRFPEFVGHIRADVTISDISLALERFMEFYSSDYEDEFIENYVGEAKKLLDEFSNQLIKMAEEDEFSNQLIKMAEECVEHTTTHECKKGNL